MDFHTMVSKFKRSVLEEGNEKELEELTAHSRERVKKYIRDGTPSRHTPKYSFKQLFKDAPHFDRSGDAGPMRMAIQMEPTVAMYATEMFQRITDQGWMPIFGVKNVIQRRQRLDADGGGFEEVEIEMPTLNMKKEIEYTIPKGPRAGETITQVKTSSLGKLVAKIGTADDQNWWKENQNSLREMDNVNDWFLRPWMNEYKAFSMQRPVIILTRHPIDVARMSDFSLTRSCHSEGSSYFSCAIDESKGHGMVAYLIKGEDWEEVKDKLNHDEIFADGDAGIGGIEPVARVRIRKLYNKTTDEEFATVENRVYGMDIPDFLPTVQKWARESQKDMWMGENGNLDPNFLPDDEFVLIGGDYLDTQIDDQLTSMFEGTEWEQDAYEVFRNTQYEYEDYFDEKSQDRYEEAEERVNRIQREYDGEFKNGSGYISIEEGWDDIPYIIDASYSTEWRFIVADDWWGSTGQGRSAVPGYSDSWQLRRDFEKLLDDAFENAGMYQGYDASWEFEEDSDNEIVIRYYERAEITQRDEDGIDEAEQFLDSMLRELDDDDNWKNVRNNLRIKLIEEEYLPPGAYQKAETELPSMEFKNLQVLYDEEDPYEGISIVFSGEAEETHDMAWDNEPAPVRYINTYNKFDDNGENIAGLFLKKLSTGAVKTTVNAAVRAAFKRMARTAAKYAEKQMAFKFPQKQQGMFGTPEDTRYQAPDYSMPEMPMDEFEVHYKTISDAAKGTVFDIGLYMNISIGVSITKETYEAVMLFVKYLDNNADMLVQAARKVADDAYNTLAEPARRSRDDRQDLESERAYARSSGLDPQGQMPRPPNPNAIRGRLGDPVPVGEAKLKEAIKKAIMKRLLQEQERFETRLFQVNLRIQIDPKMGGGIEQKLNRIRAIEGVTVVAHDEVDKRLGRQVVEARVKFHPDSDALRPGTYVTQTLVPEINSSKLVPGVKVIDIVKGSLKRLDK